MSESQIGCLGTFIAIVFLLCGGALFAGWHYDTTRGGEHSGYVTAIESRGLIWRNWNVYFKTDNSSSQEDVYCVSRDSTELVSKLKEANKQRKQVTINYEGMRSFGYGICDGEYITNVE